jgi:hypothetical protein
MCGAEVQSELLSESYLGRNARQPQTDNRKAQRNAGQLAENLFDDI